MSVIIRQINYISFIIRLSFLNLKIDKLNQKYKSYYKKNNQRKYSIF